MTPEEIKLSNPSDMSTNSWLREVCLQLALLNEARKPEVIALRKPAPPLKPSR